MTEERCGNCRFQQDGRCRRYPPSAIEIFQSAQPVVTLHSWCGEWQEPIPLPSEPDDEDV